MTKIVRRPHASKSLWAAAWLFYAATFTTDAAYADTLPSCDPAVLTLIEAAELLRIDVDELNRLAARDEVPARRIGESWRFNCAALMAWLNGDWELIAAAVAPRAADPASFVAPAAPPAEFRSPLTAQGMTEVTATGTANGREATSPSASGPLPGDGQNDAIGEAPVERTAEDIFLRDQRVLLAPGDVTLNFGQFYSESDSQLFASVDGGTAFATAEQEALITTFQGRIGVGEETELFASTSYFNQDSDVFFGSEKLASSGRSDFGDVSFGVRHTLMKERLGRPNIIATINGRIPTGDTSDAIGVGLSFVKSVDPAALFASMHYTHTFSENFVDVTLLEPEDRLDLNFGFALGLNDTLSLSTSVSGVFTGATRFPNAELRQQDDYRLGFGLTSWLATGLYIEPSVSFSLGGPGDSFAFGISVFTFTP